MWGVILLPKLSQSREHGIPDGEFQDDSNVYRFVEAHGTGAAFPADAFAL